MLRTQIFKYFGLGVLVFGLLSALIGVQIIRTQIIGRAETQVQSDLNSAWGILLAQEERLETVLKFTANKEALIKAVEEGNWDDAEFRSTMENVRISFGLDFLSIMTPQGKVVIRSASPYNSGDYFVSEPAIKEAIEGRVGTNITLMDAEALDRENQDLSEQAFFVFEDTPKARPTDKTTEARGMVMFGAVPMLNHNMVKAVLYGGVLLNRNEKLIDKIQQNLFQIRNEKNRITGSVTMFLQDCRIATTVRLTNGDRVSGYHSFQRCR